MRKHIKSLRQGIRRAQFCQRSGYSGEAGGRTCCSVQLGALLGFLEENEVQCIWSDNPDPAKQYPFSVNGLTYSFEEIPVEFKNDGHSSCSRIPEIREKFKKLVKERESPVTEAHLKYMEAQRKKTGL